MMVGIQADDLTGACDTAAVFATRGLETVVLLPEAKVPVPSPAVVALDTESRGLPPAVARRRARTATAELVRAGADALYKKVDSTLRGAVAAELGGALEGAGLREAVLAPAFPAQRRVVLDGILRVDGQAADATAVARDPTFPRTGASVLALLGSEDLHPVSLVPLATVRRGVEAVKARLTRWPGAVVCDAETATDVAVIASATAGSPVLLAGAAGLAAAVAARLPAGAAAPRPPLRLPFLVVAGSAHPVTRSQIERLEARGGARVIAAPVESAGESGPEREAMARRLAERARRSLDGDPVGTLLVTGGETAVAVCRALGASGLRLAGEVEPGLARGSLLDGPFAGLTVITKAGGFGDPEAVVRVLEACA